MDELMEQVPPAYRERFVAIAALTDAFCDAHLNDEYKTLCREMAVGVCQEGSPVLRGKPVSWAGGVVYTIGWVNFLTDPDQSPHMTTAQLSERIGVSTSTLMAKSKIIREGLNLMPFDPNWCLPSRLADNPVMMVTEMLGLAADGSPATDELRQELLDMGVVPFAPADGSANAKPDDGGSDNDDSDNDDDDMTGRGVVGRIGF